MPLSVQTVVDAGKGSRMDEWVRVVMGMGKAVWTLDAAENGYLVELGAKGLDVDGLPEFFG